MNIIKQIGLFSLILLSGCITTESSEHWTYSENENHFDKNTFIESSYYDDNDLENSGLWISCDKGGENEIFTTFMALKDEAYLLYPDKAEAKFEFVIDDVLDATTSGTYIYETENKVFIGMSNKLPKQLLNVMANPSMRENILHVRMTVKGVHIKTFRKSLATDDILSANIVDPKKSSHALLTWTQENVNSKGFYHSFEKHVKLAGFGDHIENYNGCNVSTL